MLDDYSDLQQRIPSSDKSPQLEGLQSEVQVLKDARNEERFLFGLCLIVLLDVIFFSHMDGWGGPLSILIIELVIIIMMARRLGVEDITEMLDKYLMNGYLKKE